MGKRLILILALAFVVSFSVAAYAEVQNVKVSGDLLIRGITRDSLSLSKIDKYDASGITTTTRVRVDADLTDNVMTTVRLINERTWGEETDVGMFSAHSSNVDIDLAYVTLKEFLYSPLTLTVGRQEIRFGNAMIIGDPDTNQWAAKVGVPFDLSSRKAFDAIRATLNYDPLVIDLVYSKIAENNLVWWLTTGPGVVESNDANLMGLNGRYDLTGLGIKGAFELYYYFLENKDLHHTSFIIPGPDINLKTDVTQTLGFLLSGEIIKNLSGSLEYAHQWGRASDSGINEFDATRDAWAVQAGVNYAIPITKMSPNVGLIYSRFSGDRKTDGHMKAWNPMFEDQVPNALVNAIFPQTDVQAVNLKASLKPMEDITLSGVYGWYILSAKPFLGLGNVGPYDFYPLTENKRGFGHAVDLTATYDYTEDVQFGLTWGYFDPGRALNKAAGFKHTATQVIGSMKVTF